ncbi:hypothetical protein BDV36DRAFT_250975 [Aspergillus pseudocaelatus]|uniref:Zn(2)-C6 fungal-type domain-containing protein n=1 Tax=Aspergillus pseudocaelatus TaxID=1825620 RepID=A0ABQ6WRC4_9EURO|nr:hypothetical protein BDV36DRAFT_250975 [Aspergillus pseudocaelatus]
MVYCGKPSRACLDCRVKRRKCDLSRPACRQCVKAGSRCDGYRDQDSLIIRDQTAEIMGKVQPFPDNSPSLVSPHGNQAVPVRSERSQQTVVDQSKGPPVYHPWLGIVVPLEHQALHFYFHHYAVNRFGPTPNHPDCLAIIYACATGPGYLAHLINAVGLVSLAYQKKAPALSHEANRAYSWALRDIRTALTDPIEAASDQMLVAVMLLVLYETVSGDSENSLRSWDRHVDGALTLVQLRGASQLRNRIGRSIFLNLRTEILINCLQRRLRVPITLINWMSEARNFETAQEAPAGSLADLIVNACAVLASAKDEVMDKANLSRYIATLLSIDKDLERWTQDLPVHYEFKALTPPDETEELYLGRCDIYSGAEMVYTWNLQRCARIILRQALVRALSLHFSSLSPPSASFPLSYRHLLRTSDALIQETSSEICYSLPYILHIYDKPGKPGDLRAASILPLLWPLYIAGTAHTAPNTLREWVIAQMQKIEEVTGVQQAKFVALDLERRCLFPHLL